MSPLVLKTKSQAPAKGVMWAAFAKGFVPNKDHPIVVSGAADEAAAKAEFEIYADVYAATNGDTTKASDAVMAKRAGG